MSAITNEWEHADFLQEFSILRQNYCLQSLEDLNKWVMFLENAFKDVYSIEGDESAFLEILIIHNIVLFVCNNNNKTFEDIYKNLEKSREILFNLSKCPLEIISMMQTFAGILLEKENIVESEKEYLMALIHYFPVVSDPRGRGTYSSNYLLALTWKASMVAHYYKKDIDAELWEELLDSTIHNLTQARIWESRGEKEGPLKKWSKLLTEGNTKNKFSQPLRSSPHKGVSRDSRTKINIEDIDVELLSNMNNESSDPFDDLKYTITQNKFLFYHWALYKDIVEDIEDYMKYGGGNQLDFFIYLLRANPCMYMSNTKFSQDQIRDFTFNDGPNNMLNLKSTSSILSGKDHLSSSLSQASFSSNMSTTTKEKRQRSLHHGAYQHILNKENHALSRSECNGVAYVWGTDTHGQLGSANISNMKFDEMGNNFKRLYPRIWIGLKDYIVKEVWWGNEHSLAVTTEGNVFAWGNNTNKQLGIGYNSPKTVSLPTRVYNIQNVIAVSCGYEHSMAISDQGDLYSWGHGEGGLLGHGELDDEATPKIIQEFSKKNLKVK